MHDQLHFRGAPVLRGIQQRLAADVLGLVAHAARQRLALAAQRGGERVAVLRGQLLAEAGERLAEGGTVAGWGAQFVDAVAALHQYLLCAIERALQREPRGVVRRHAVDAGLEPQDQTLNALQQRVMELTRDALALDQHRLVSIGVAGR